MSIEGIKLFLDSGAFSVKSKGVSVDVYDYINFVRNHRDAIHIYANLDVIGDAKATLQNQKIMEASGLHPLPVFHLGENKKYLMYYIDRYDYIALGGLVGKASQLVYWLDDLFSRYLCHADGIPRVKVHGFGLTSLRLMLRYPWYSVDSTSWVITSRMGVIYVPRFKGGNWVYNENSWKISVSAKSPLKRQAGKHFTTLSPTEQRIILNYIHSKGYKMGKSKFVKVSRDYKPKDNERWAEKKTAGGHKRLLEIIEEPGLCNSYQLRDQINAIYFLDLEKSMPEWPWPFKIRAARTTGLGLYT